MENQSHSLVAGLFVVVFTVAVIAGALWLGPPKGPKLSPIDLVTRHSVAGLKVDAPVEFRGVEIGHVESITFDPGQRGQIRVRVAVDPTAPLTQSTYAKLSSQGITGVAFIQLDDAVGTTSAPLVISSTKVPQLELQASFLERAEDDMGNLVVKVDRVQRLADDVDQKLTVLDALATTAKELTDATGDLHRNTLPRVNAVLDDVAVDARELKSALHHVDERPQSLIFGLQPPPPGPCERGFVAATETAR